MSYEDDLAALQAQLDEATTVAAEASANSEAAREAEQAILRKYQAEMEEARARLIAADNARREVVQRAENLKRQMLQIEAEERHRKEMEEAERKRLEREAEAERLREMRELESLLMRDRFDKLTMGAYWREFAKDHQLVAGRFIAENRYVIEADVMGLGKTLTSIITVEMAQQISKDASPEFPLFGEEKQVYQDGQYVNKIVGAVERPVGQRILYLCPSSLVKNVRDEWKQWAAHRNVMFVYKMSKAERMFALDLAHKNFTEYVVICNYEAWVRDKALLQQFKDMDFDTVIIDEAHNAKSMDTSIWKGINFLITNPRPEYVIPMTGTPILNRPQELYTLLNMVAPEIFYHENDFLYTYCEQFTNDKGTTLWRFQPGGLDRISKRISRYFIRRTKEQAGIKLPPKTIIKHDIEVDKVNYPEQSRAREEMTKYAAVVCGKNKDKAITSAAEIAMITRLRQIETWPAGIIQYEKDDLGNFVFNSDGSKSIALQLDIEESQKVDYIIRQDKNGEWNGLIPEAIQDERMVVFLQFIPPMVEIERRCKAAGIKAVLFNGSTPDPVREQIRKDFDITKTPNREESQWDIVLCNYKTGGVGLNLTAATQLIILDEEWNPGKRDQAYDRIHRMGQDKPVTIHVIRNQGSIDDWLGAIMDSKDKELVGDFNDTMASISLSDFIGQADDSGLI